MREESLRSLIGPPTIKPWINSSFDAAGELKRSILDPTAEITQPPDVIRINGVTTCRLGSFSVILGKPKAGKGLFTGAITAAALSGSCSLDGIRGEFANGKLNVLYFDTEQGNYWASIACKRICRAVGVANPENLTYYNLQQYTPAERLQMVENAIMEADNLLLVVIDGIRDLVTSINDEEQATDIVSKLLKWCAQKQIHIITLLHQNKNDLNARGHLGTELINRAECTISITKKEEAQITLVKPDFARGEAFTPFSFTFHGDSGLPILCDSEISTKEKPRTSKTAQRDERLRFILKEHNRVKSGYLKDRYKEMAGCSEKTAYTHISDAVTSGVIVRNDDGSYDLPTPIYEDENTPF